MSVALASSSVSVGLPRQFAALLRDLAPQGWGFFATNLQNEVLEVHAYERGDWQRRDRQHRTYALGLNRERRALQLTVESIAARIPEQSWKSCSSLVRLCAATWRTEDDLLIPSSALGCGRIALVRRRSETPFSVRNDLRQRQFKFVIARAEC